ncbi:cytochrome P450 [Boletus coccyginus]|nr:cytochrome P450 [Boletus coccyginus]
MLLISIHHYRRGLVSVPFDCLTAIDDVYNGFRIPKGAILITNLWVMAHDESKYPNSHAFVPERFLDDDGSLKPNDSDIKYIAFGFGRRMCVGRYGCVVGQGVGCVRHLETPGREWGGDPRETEVLHWERGAPPSIQVQDRAQVSGDGR